MTAEGFELGLNSFGEVATDGDRILSDAETVRLLVDEARLAESVGLDVFSVGEHYREGHTDSATPVLLAAMATATDRIRLGTSVTVLSTNDPVRLYTSSRPSTRSRTAAPRSSSAAPRRPSRSPCSVTTWRTTSGCSRRSSTSSYGSSGTNRSPGRARYAALWSRSGCTRGCGREASRPGSASAGARTR